MIKKIWRVMYSDDLPYDPFDLVIGYFSSYERAYQEAKRFASLHRSKGDTEYAETRFRVNCDALSEDLDIIAAVYITELTLDESILDSPYNSF